MTVEPRSGEPAGDGLSRDLREALDAYQRGDMAAAAPACERALAAKPDDVLALQILSLARFTAGRPDEAIAVAQRAIAANPNDPDSWNNLGLMLARLHRPAEALRQYDQAVALAPRHAVALLNRGNALWELNRLHDAVVSYDQALAVQPDYVEALYNRANIAALHSHFGEALEGYDKVLALRPDYPDALFARGRALAELKRRDEALADFRRLLEIAPHHPFARGTGLRLAQEACDWSTAWPRPADVEGDVTAGKPVVPPFAFLGMSSSPEAHLACARTWMRRYPPAPALWRGEAYRHDKIRLAYISPDLRNNAISHLLVGLFEMHDRQRFETFAISTGYDDKSAMRRRVVDAFDRFVDATAMSDADVARLLREHEIDVAIDLCGIATGCRPRILAHRPAPVQVNYPYPGTMAAAHMDYVIADRTVIPPEQQVFFAEKVVYLPDSYQPNDSKRPIAPTRPSRAACGLPESGFVFCGFNASYKITPELFDVWMRLLRAIPDSVLWLYEDNPAAARNLRREAEARQVAPERLVFAPRMAIAEHLARHACADVFLDTLPYNGHTTGSDALWAGLPVLTCSGAAFPGRVGASLLRAVGLPELITGSLSEYEALALRLAKDRAMLAALKARLAENRGTAPLFDTERFSRHIEAAYAQMVERSRQGLPPAGFDVAPLPR